MTAGDGGETNLGMGMTNQGQPAQGVEQEAPMRLGVI